MLKEGIHAPDFVLPDAQGSMHNLKDYQGKWVVLYFYPKDDTPGCTKEACAFRDAHPQYADRNAVVLGVSVDPAKSHAKFADKYGLPFTLLADTDKKVVQQYEAWGLKKFMGREYNGTLRISYLIAPDGTIAKTYDAVKPEEHAAQVLSDIRALSS